jgi:hypothetical protein
MVVCVAAVVGCDSSVDLPHDRLWSSANFDYRTRAVEAVACPAVLDALEQHLATMRAYLGFTWPASRRITYYKFADGADFDAHSDCGAHAGACASEAHVEAPDAFATHELIHVYLFPTGHPPMVLVEGAAVALSCGSAFYASQKPTTVGWQDLASYSAGQLEVYPPGAWLASYLLDVFGPARFMQLYGSVPFSATAADLDAAVQRIYGKSLADIWSDVLAEDQPRNTCVWECSGAPLALDGRPLHTEGTCGVETNHAFTLAGDATLAFTTDAADQGLGSCGPGGPPPVTVLATPSAVSLYRLPAGRYYFHHGAAAGTIVADDVTTTLDTTCDASNGGALIAHPNVFISVPGSSAPWFLPRPPGLAHGVAVSAVPGSAALCDSCADPTTCTDTGQLGVPWAASQTLRLTPDPKRAWTSYLLDLF